MEMIHIILLVILFSSIFVELFFSSNKERIILTFVLLSFLFFGNSEYNNIFGIFISVFMIVFESYRMMETEEINYYALIYPIIAGLLCL